ncbi:MAG: XdhC family protein [Desulfobacterales bacterium]
MTMILRMTDLLETSQAFCLATVISSSVKEIMPGNKTIVLADGSLEGGTGNQQLDGLIYKYALQALREQKKQIVDIVQGIKVFFDIIAQKSRLILCGAGHIAKPLAEFARRVDFAVTIIDDRADFADPSRFKGCEVIADDFVPALQNANINSSSFVVIITRGHEHDTECLSEILPRKTAYVGLIGSRRRVGFVLEMLSRQGIPSDRLKDVFTPIGLPIGAESPEEIALSITAELVCVRRKTGVQARKLRSVIGI